MRCTGMQPLNTKGNRMKRKHSLAHNAMYNFLYQLLNVLFPLLSAGYVSRILAPEGIGRVMMAQNGVSYFVMLAALGIPSYGTREIARCADREQQRSIVFSELFLINGMATTVCLAAYALLCPCLIPGDAGLQAAVGLELVFCYVGIDWLFRGLEAYGRITARNLLVKAASLAALYLFVRDRTDYIVYALIHSLGIGCSGLYNMLHAGKYVKLKLTGLNLQRHMRPIFWLLLGSVTASLYSKVDITMLGILADPVSVAYYTNSHKIIGLVLSLVTALTAVFLPRLSYLYASDSESYSRCLTDGLQLLLLLAVPACVGICLVADDLMACVFGSAFLPGAAVLRILAVFTIIKGAGDLLCYQTIVSSGMERFLFRSRVAAGIANVVLNAVLIPRYAHCGAAIASVISELLVNGLLLPRALRIASVSLPAGFCAGTLVSTAVMGIGVVLVHDVVATAAGSLALTVGTGVLLYGLLQAAVNGKTIRRLWDSIRNHT